MLSITFRLTPNIHCLGVRDKLRGVVYLGDFRIETVCYGNVSVMLYARNIFMRGEDDKPISVYIADCIYVGGLREQRNTSAYGNIILFGARGQNRMYP